MVTSLPFLTALGTVLGFLAGIGVGGGSLLMLWLTVVMGMEHSAARQINLLFFLPSALISCFFRWKQGSLSLRQILPAVICGCIAAALCSRLGQMLDTAVVETGFGWLLIVTGLRELFQKKKTTGDQSS